MAGNVMPGYADDNTAQKTYSINATFADTLKNAPVYGSLATVHSARDAYKLVLSDVGCTQPAFDDHDIRIINETLTGSYSCNGSQTGKPGLPDHENDINAWETYPGFARSANWDTDLDGLPDWWENIHGLDPNSANGSFVESNADVDKNGYTNLEEYLHWMTRPHYFMKNGTTLNINLSNYTKGFTNNPVFSVSDVINGTANLSANSSLVDFIPSAEGLAEFTFMVTDNEGSQMYRKIGIYVGNIPPDTGFGYSYYKDRSNTQLVIVDNPTSLKNTSDNPDLSDIEIFPNPVNTILSVKFNSNVGASSEFRIMDLSGKTIYTENDNIQKNPNSIHIDVAKLTAGIYFLNIRNERFNKTVRFIKN